MEIDFCGPEVVITILCCVLFVRIRPRTVSKIATLDSVTPKTCVSTLEFHIYVNPLSNYNYFRSGKGSNSISGLLSVSDCTCNDSIGFGDPENMGFNVGISHISYSIA